MKQRNRKKIGIRAMRKLLNAWPYECYSRFKYLGWHGIGLVIVPGVNRFEDEGWMGGPSMEG